MKIKNNKIDIVMEVICLVLLIGMVLYLLIGWSSIPDKVPMHYDWAGNIDRWGNKAELVILPIMSWIMYLFLTGIEQVPKIWNTGVTVTEENQARVYRVLKYMIKSLKLIVVVDFALMDIYTILGTNLPSWFTPVFMIAVFGDLVFWLVRLVQVK